MINSLFKHSITYSIAGFLGRGIGLILLPFYTRVFSPKDYGILDLINISVLFITNIVSFQINQSVGRYYVDTDSVRKKITIVSTGFMYYVVSFCLATSLIIIFSKKISYTLFQTDSHSDIITIAGIYIIFLSLYYYTSILFRYRFESKRFSSLSILNVLLNSSLIIFFVLFLKKGVLGVFWGKLVSSIFLFTISFYLIKNNFNFKNFSFRVWKRMFKFGAPLIPAVLLLFVMQYCDRFMINYFLGLSHLGIYAIGIRLTSIISLLFIGFKFAWAPYIFKNYREPRTKEVISILFKYLFLLSLVFVLIITLFSPEFLFILTTKNYYDAYKVVPLLAGGTVLYTIGAYFSLGFGIAEKNIFVFYINLIVAILNIILNLTLIPRFGIQGAALATFLSMLTFFILSLSISNRLYKIDFNISKLYIPIMVVVAGVILEMKVFGAELSILLMIIKLVIVVFFMAILFSSKVISYQEIKELILKKA